MLRREHRNQEDQNELPGPNLAATVVGDALLAQSVEHFHGKEKVIGSFPMEGSTNTLVAAQQALPARLLNGRRL